MSEVCHIPPETRGKHRDLRGHADAHRCCVKSLIGSALVGFGVRQHARPESISKRAPSTTRTSLRLESTTCERSANDYRTRRHVGARNAITCELSDLRRLRRALAAELCQIFESCQVVAATSIELRRGSDHLVGLGRTATSPRGPQCTRRPSPTVTSPAPVFMLGALHASMMA